MTEKNAKKYTLKQRMRDDFTRYFLAALSLVPSLGQAATSAISHDSEADKTTSVQNIEQTQIRIGNWTEDQLGNSMMVGTSYKRPSIKKLPDRPDAFVDHSKVDWEEAGGGYLAKTHSDGSITMTMPDAQRAAQKQNSASRNFLNGETPAQFAEFLHEVNHAKDLQYLNIGAQYHTPTNAVRFNNLTENVSHSISYLALANFYQNAEKQGIKTIWVNNEEKPLSYVLDNYPGLRQTYEKYGLDLNNKESVARYVKLGIAYKNVAKNAYESQGYGSYVSAREASKQKPWKDRVNEAKSEDKDFDEISHLMVSKCYIGLNTIVDLSSCYDLLNDMSKQDVYNLVEQQSGGTEYVVSSDNIVEIDKYLTQQCIVDDDKNDYIAAQFFSIIEKSDDVDLGLKNIMLQSHKEVKTADFTLAYHNLSRGGR